MLLDLDKETGTMTGFGLFTQGYYYYLIFPHLNGAQRTSRLISSEDHLPVPVVSPISLATLSYQIYSLHWSHRLLQSITGFILEYEVYPYLTGKDIFIDASRAYNSQYQYYYSNTSAGQYKTSHTCYTMDMRFHNARNLI